MAAFGQKEAEVMLESVALNKLYPLFDSLASDPHYSEAWLRTDKYSRLYQITKIRSILHRQSQSSNGNRNDDNSAKSISTDADGFAIPQRTHQSRHTVMLDNLDDILSAFIAVVPMDDCAQFPRNADSEFFHFHNQLKLHALFQSKLWRKQPKYFDQCCKSYFRIDSESLTNTVSVRFLSFDSDQLEAQSSELTIVDCLSHLIRLEKKKNDKSPFWTTQHNWKDFLQSFNAYLDSVEAYYELKGVSLLDNIVNMIIEKQSWHQYTISCMPHSTFKPSRGVLFKTWAKHDTDTDEHRIEYAATPELYCGTRPTVRTEWPDFIKKGATIQFKAMDKWYIGTVQLLNQTKCSIQRSDDNAVLHFRDSSLLRPIAMDDANANKDFQYTVTATAAVDSNPVSPTRRRRRSGAASYDSPPMVDVDTTDMPRLEHCTPTSEEAIPPTETSEAAAKSGTWVRPKNISPRRISPLRAAKIAARASMTTKQGYPRGRREWEMDEDITFGDALRKYQSMLPKKAGQRSKSRDGKGIWATILADPQFKDTLRHRDGQQLRSRYRHYQNSGQLNSVMSSPAQK